MTKPERALTHGIAQCEDCDWHCEDFLTVQARAAQHARQHGHRVNAELCYIKTYDRRASVGGR